MTSVPHKIDRSLGRSRRARKRLPCLYSIVLHSFFHRIRCLSSFSFHNGSIHRERRGENEVEEWMRRSGEREAIVIYLQVTTDEKKVSI